MKATTSSEQEGLPLLGEMGGGLYIHIPFCKQACHYCDFHFSTSLGNRKAMLDSLHKELVLRRPEFEEIAVETIYFGGGTPSILTPGEIQSLVETIHENYKVVHHPEITLEANPDDFSKGRVKELSKTQVNRLSIGVQSFFGEDLQFMNRAHTAQQAHASITEALEYFNNVTIDLIYGLPHMSVERWEDNLRMAFSLNVPHISAYALTVEPKTALAHFIKKGKVPPLEEGLARLHFERTVDYLKDRGFVHYEISNFGKEGFFSRNNMAYWSGKPYLGIGPSAHSYKGNKRSWNVRNNPKYVAALQSGTLPSESETLLPRDRYNELVMTGLRTQWGIPIQKISMDFGSLYEDHLLKSARIHIVNQLLMLEAGYLKVTEKGKFLVDGLASDLFLVD